MPTKPQLNMITPFRTVVLFFSLALLSLVILPYLPIQLFPTNQTHSLHITYNVADAPPELVEQLATSPLEGILSQLADIQQIESLSGYAKGSISIEFDRHTEIEARKLETRALIRQLYPKLAHIVSYPVIQQNSSSSSDTEHIPLLTYTISAPGPAFQIRNIVGAAFQKGLSTNGDLREIALSEVPSPEVTVRYHSEGLHAVNLKPTDLHTAIRERFLTYYPGSISTREGGLFFIKYIRGTGDLNALENTPIPLPSGIQTTLGKLAHIRLEEQEPTRYFRINGKNAITVSLFVREGTNTITRARALKSRIKKIAATLPAGYALHLAHDNTKYLSEELYKTLYRTLLSVAILILFIVLAYQDWKSLAILLSGLMVNLGLTILILWMLDIQIHLYSLAGLTIALGILIDNGLIVLEYCRQQQRHLIVTPLLGSTLTTISALALVWLLPEEEQYILRDFAAVASIALGSSLAVAYWFIPGMFQLIQGGIHPDKHRIPMSRLRYTRRWFQRYYQFTAFCARYRKTYLLLWVLAFGIPLFLLPNKIAGWNGYNRLFGSRMYQEVWRAPLEHLTGGALRIFLQNMNARSGYRQYEQTLLVVHATLPAGSTLVHMNALIQQLEARLEKEHGVEKYVSNVVSGEQAHVEITFRPDADRALPLELRARLIHQTREWGGVDWTIYGIGAGYATGTGSETPSYRIKLMGYNYDTLETWAQHLKNRLESHPRVQHIDLDAILHIQDKPTYAYRLTFNQTQLVAQRTTPEGLFAAIATQSGQQSLDMRLPLIDGATIPLRILPQFADSFSIYTLMHTALQTDSLRSVQLAPLSQLMLERRTPAIYRENRQFQRMVSYDYTGSAVFGERFVEDILQEMRVQLPPGYSMNQHQPGNVSRTTGKQRATLLLILALANFFICAILFENLRQSLTIVLSLPLSLIGLFLTFAWGEFFFDQGGYAAIILLGGIAVNASILVVSAYNKTPQRMARPNRTLLLVLIQRARTILLTVLSTICGLAPFLWTGDTEVFWFGLAVGTIGGLAFSVFALFTTLPVFLWQPSKK